MNYLENYIRVHEILNRRISKKRKCLNCHKEFESNSCGHRICGVCKITTNSYGPKAGRIFRINFDRAKKSTEQEL